jgi:hypothetical protein
MPSQSLALWKNLQQRKLPIHQFLTLCNFGVTMYTGLALRNEDTNKVGGYLQNRGLGDLPVLPLVALRDLKLLSVLISESAALDVKNLGTRNTLLHLVILENAQCCEQKH